MTLDHYAAIITAGAWIDQQIAMYGPGLALTAVLIAIAWTCSRIRSWRERRRDARDWRARLRTELAAAEAAADDDTQPGIDDDLLAHCWDAWKAQPRKEKP
ncbi:hypothetical protein GCM10010293_40060 [Streptomyces griseoflavus]|uniref:hypothetical protein n=1 Tax=Streptomyces griseoflavus TaxID=35619 RepID=UPI00167ED95B|nr:hypothetical protein [Streptomyces griseoflavus]GGV36674.1 hypothetical protein GCM10010293_40060 [Streptomyces griseoflavus]